MQNKIQYPAILLAFLLGAIHLPAQTDWRDLQNGSVIPDENYTDQPYFVVLEDGRWLLTLTTGPGGESKAGQHVVCTTSADNGQTWTPLVDIELTGPDLPAPETNILSSWVVPFQSEYRAPGASFDRVYGIYNWGDPYTTSPDFFLKSVHGQYAFRYTDDGGATWSARHIIPYTNTEADDNNVFSGAHMAGWNVDKPLRLNGKMFFSFTKLNHILGGPSDNLGEGYIYRCDNIDSEGDPTLLDWKMLPGTVNPDGSVDTAPRGIRRTEWNNSTQVEFDLEQLTSGALLVSYRTAQGLIGEALSADEGQTWTEGAPRRYHLDGRFVRHNLANVKVWALNSGKYLMWHNNNGFTSFANRNPVWVSIGTQAGNAISWGEPEILLYHRDKDKKISYPDMMEIAGTMYLTETEKSIARAHVIDPGFLSMIDTQPSRSTKTTADLQLEQTGTLSGPYTMPALPDLGGYTPKGFTIETRFQTSNLNAGQTVFDTFSGGSGVRMTVATNGAVDFEMSDGTNSITWRSDTGVVVAGQPTHITVHVDAPVKTITMVANGRVGDGTNYNTGTGDRIFGWTHFDDAFGDVNGGNIAVGSGLNGTVDLLRVYDRALMHTEAIANYRHASGISGPAVTAGIVPSVAVGEPGQSVSFDATHSYVSELTTPVYTWDFGDGSPTVQGAVVNHTYATTGTYAVTMTISEVGTPSLQGEPVAQLDFMVQEASADAVIAALRPPGSNTVTFSAASSTLTNVPDPVYTWDFGDGNSDTGLSLQHTYASAGDYTVTLTISRAGGGSLGGSPVATESVNAGGTTAVGELLALSHDGTPGDEDNPFDTLILSNPGSPDWTYTTGGARSVMTAIDNATSGDNRLILVQEDGVSEFTDTGTAADKGWVFEIELEILSGASSGGSGWACFAHFGVRAENSAGKSAWVGLSDFGGVGDSGRIGFMDAEVTPSSDRFLSGGTAALDVDSLIGDGQYHNFKIHKYDKAGTTTVDVFMDGALVLSSPYSSLEDDHDIGLPDIQAFASATDGTAEVNIDFVNFTLYDNLIESTPVDETAPTLVSTGPANVEPSSNLVATFDEPIVLGASGDVTIRNLSHPSDTVISVGGSDPDGTLAASGNQLTIDPAADLADGDEYAVLIGSTVVEDLSGNAYAGISDTNTWSFTTGVITPSVLPVAGAVMWFDAGDVDGDGTPDENSGALSTWVNKATVGSTGNVTQGSGSAQPVQTTAAAGLNGFPVVSYDADDGLNGSTSDLLNDFTIFAVARASTTTRSPVFHAYNTGSDAPTSLNWIAAVEFSQSSTGDLNTYNRTIASGSGGQDIYENAYTTDTWYLVSNRVSGADTEFRVLGSTAGVSVASNGKIVNTTGHTTNFGVGMLSVYNSGFGLDGEIAEVIVYPTALSVDDENAVGYYLQDKYGLSGSYTPTNTFANWISGFGLAPGDQGFGDDPEGDGLKNGLEGFFGTNPGTFDAGLTEISKTGNVVTFQHPNPTTPLDDVTGSYEWSTDLQTWYDADGVDTDGSTTVNAVATPDDPLANVTTVTATIGGTDPIKVFLRAVATTP